jgi:hypothetical protein
MFDSILLNFITSQARAALMSLAGILATDGYLQQSEQPAFIAGGLVLVQMAWSLYEKVSHKHQLTEARND